MTEPRQDSLSDVQVSRLYRQYSTEEPSDAVDQRILAAAQAALADHPAKARGTAWWQRWRAPLALATTLLLTLSLSLLQGRRPPDANGEAAFKPPVPKEQRDTASVTAREQAGSPVAPAPAAPSSLAAEARAKKALQAPIGPSQSNSRLRSDIAGGQQPPAPAEGQALPAAEPAAVTPERAAPAAAAAGAARGSHEEARLEAASAADRAAPPALAKSQAVSVRTASAWLEEIRALRRDGKTEEAERQLRDFRRANPGYPLPEEFRQ